MMISTPRSTSSRRATLLVALACVAVAAPRMRAQADRLSLPLGTRVRILDGAEPRPFTGNVLRVTPDTLAVAVGGGNALVQFPTSRLTSLEVSEGRDRLRWGVTGAGIGGLAGGLIGGVAVGRDDPGGLGAIAGFFAGAILGAAGGAIVGAVIAPERWRRVTLSWYRR